MKKHAKIFPGLILAIVLFSAISCDKNDKSNPVVTFQAALNGSSEVPPNTSTSTGTATLTYDTLAKKFDIVVSYNGIAPTAGHIHKAAPGVAGGVVFGFTDVSKSPFTYSSPVLTADQKNDLFTGQYYVNLHSTAFPDGEIRGQLVRTP
ncbi:MAG TPA: CHRD domain-containing protein [Bacteroidales bacterium]|jgi:hypothetical protein|nr:CHRD domain-containing protein [Bacteroidales bacterium]